MCITIESDSEERAFLRASRRTATGKIVSASVLRDAVLRTAPQDEVTELFHGLSEDEVLEKSRFSRAGEFSLPLPQKSGSAASGIGTTS